MQAVKRAIEKVYLPICHTCGDRPWPVQARATEVRCDGCNRALDHFRVALVPVQQGDPARPSWS